jgi:hypothetical protein
MCKIMRGDGYWMLWTDRCEQGIINTTMSRHGIAGPDGIMRFGMMLGTCVSVRHDAITIDYDCVPDLPLISADLGFNSVTCSSAIAKLTKIMYQRGIDTAKHGANLEMIPAMEMRVKMPEQCYMIINTDMGITTAWSGRRTPACAQPCTRRWSYWRTRLTPRTCSIKGGSLGIISPRHLILLCHHLTLAGLVLPITSLSISIKS